MTESTCWSQMMENMHLSGKRTGRAFQSRRIKSPTCGEPPDQTIHPEKSKNRVYKNSPLHCGKSL